MRFVDRVDAGRQLAARLEEFRAQDVVVLGLPRGGVPVAHEVAQALGAPLDVVVVRKLGVPHEPELGMGAIAEGGVRILNEEVIRDANVDDGERQAVERRERAELERRARRFRGGRACVSLEGRVALVVDDGIATGSTARAACRVARARGAARVVFAAPVGPGTVKRMLAGDADDVVVPYTPDGFRAIGQYYDDFTQVTDDEVVSLLAPGARHTLDGAPGVDAEVTIHAGAVRLPGHLTIPDRARGVVIFAHGSGSSRHSPRNQHVADLLHEASLGTLLFDLLTPGEALDRANVFDIRLLARRLTAAARWVRAHPQASGLPVGYFGASTGAGAALLAAIVPGDEPAAIVSRGGRPDLAAPHLGEVRSPTLLIVGGFDDAVVALNREAKAQLRCRSRLELVPGATHLFEEPGTLQRVAELARDWFAPNFLAARSASARGAPGPQPV